jgi:alkanesulfonate monooxygenase SsuD/methylene tetrahydromethanopterin reductase-like flavin-dependent oxidoreductase (luciferase family)
MTTVTLGLDTFGDVGNDGNGHPENIRMIVEQGILADGVGPDHFAIGEHHINEMPIAAPDVILAAIASRTTRIRLGSAVTVLSSDDPVRVSQRYATLDAVSNGRAEVILVRGSSVESFPPPRDRGPRPGQHCGQLPSGRGAHGSPRTGH